MSRTRYGWLAGIAGAAVAAWWWRSRHAHDRARRERGEVIFRNTPAATGEGIL